ncbi:MAG: Gfo/Idh/MocA family oxidoreductase, partial [Verrucomicrobia bacterium]|nr:Gfo/Idh/MocA family oxidoreductase [Verrucomicrobiota bacterium]
MRDQTAAEIAMNPTQASRMNRRQFLQRAAVAAAPMVLPASALGLNGTVAPSNRIFFGCIGIGGRARHVMPSFLAQSDLVFTAVSDCRDDRMKSAKEIMDQHYGNKDCRMFTDFQELLAQKDLDGVFIATGDRWHTTAAILAARAGKDIYCEKPVSMCIGEGRALVENCRRFGTIY